VSVCNDWPRNTRSHPLSGLVPSFKFTRSHLLGAIDQRPTSSFSSSSCTARPMHVGRAMHSCCQSCFVLPSSQTTVATGETESDCRPEQGMGVMGRVDRYTRRWGSLS